MGATGKFILSGIIGFLGIIALFFAAAAHSGPLYIAGLIFFVGCVLFIMFMINRAFHEGADGEQKSSG
ncbi:MAG: hypothetical protein R3316_12210 [Rhodovibrionaceae bacterium]|nr:hypothetical protein [Rhodovibrionaceae bacterium]